MEIKAVFFDIDGTLVNDSRMVLKSTEKAIRALKEQGIFVGLATGRGPFFVRPFIERYDLISQSPIMVSIFLPRTRFYLPLLLIRRIFVS